MKKVIPKLYLACIVIGIIIVIAASITKNNVYKGQMWEASKSPVYAEKILQESDHMRVYLFPVSDFAKGNDCLFFRTSHMEVSVYINEEAPENLIYEFASRRTIFGKTSGSQYHFVEYPPTAEKIIVKIDTVYPQFYQRPVEFYQTDGIWAFKNTIQSSLPEAMISCILVMLGLILIVYWLCAGRKIDLQNSALYFGCFAALLGAWTFNETSLATLMFSNRTAASLLGFTLLFTMLQPMVLFTHVYLKSEETIIRNSCCLVISLAMFVCLGLHFSGIVEMRQMAIVAHLLIVLVLIYIIFCFVFYIKRYGISKRVIVNIIGMSILTLSAFWDLSTYYAENLINDVVGRLGMLTYIAILAAEVMTEFMHQLEENRKLGYYKELATVDTLTGFHNRNAYEKWEKDTGDCADIALITFDLNNLKVCNDTKGHLVGDQYIIEAANIIKAVFYKVGECYRIGGDEFLVIITKASKVSIDKYIQKLRKRESEYNMHADDIEMCIACGYAAYQGKNDNIDEMRKRADVSMYQNKAEMKRQERKAGV